MIAYAVGAIIATIWVLIAIVIKQSSTKGELSEKLEQSRQAADTLKAQADISNRLDVDRADLYRRLRGRSYRDSVPTIPRDE